MPRFRVKERDEISRIELADKGINQKTAYLIREERGYQKSEIHAVPYLVHALDAEVPTVRVKVRGEKGDIVRQRDLSDKKYFWSGCSPFRQIIYDFLRENEANYKLVSLDEICDYVLVVKKHLEDSYENRELIKDLVKVMNKAGKILTSYGNYKSGLPLELKRKVREVEAGFDPDVMEIFDFVDRKSAASFADISDHMIVDLKWMKRRGTLVDCIVDMVDKGYLVVIAKEIYETHLRVESFL